MLKFTKLPTKKGASHAKYAVIKELKTKQNRMGRIEWKGKYKFVAHPKRKATKKELAEINAFVVMLNG